MALEILELNDHVGEDIVNSLHELIHESLLLLEGRALLAQTQVEGVAEIILIVGTAIQDNRESLVGVNTGSASVERQLANLTSEC